MYILKHCLLVSNKDEPKHKWPRNAIPRYVLHNNIYIYLMKGIYYNAYNGPIQNNPKLKSAWLSSTVEWVTKLWSVHTREYYITMRMNPLPWHITTSMNLPNVMLNKKSWTSLFLLDRRKTGQANLCSLKWGREGKDANEGCNMAGYTTGSESCWGSLVDSVEHS